MKKKKKNDEPMLFWLVSSCACLPLLWKFEWLKVLFNLAFIEQGRVKTLI